MKDTDTAEMRVDANAANTVMDRYSRQIAALGVEVMQSLGGLRVLVIGQGGVGVETAKDLILQGPKAVVVHDNKITTVADLGTNFYLRDADVGVNPRSIGVNQLKDLNPYVEVSATAGPITDDLIALFGAVIVTEALPLAELSRINAICRAKKVTFLWAVTMGGFCAFFADFGAEHLVTDLDGEPKRDFVVQSWANDLVQVTSEAHDFYDGDQIIFHDIEGPLSVMNELQGVRVRRVYQRNAQGRNALVQNRFRVDVAEATRDGKPVTIDLSALQWKNGGGTLSEVKAKKVFKFRTLEESIVAPCIDESMGTDVLHMDQGKWFGGVGTQLHLGLAALTRFQTESGGLPKLHCKKDAAKVVELAKAISKEHAEAKNGVTVETVNEALVTKMAIYARAELSGFCAFLGGVAAQEVLKRFGKWTPVNQWLYYDMLDVLTTEPPNDAVVSGTRYDYQISVFGKGFQTRISNDKWFLVGCGALGCEYIKAFALMGIGCGSRGRVYITDMDRIELSNLSRQFLFRSQHVQKPKSVCAAAVAATMNPDLGNNITCYENKVCTETEDVFHPAFWDNLTGVWNALDNVHARKYTDSKCLLHSLPLMESGTQGTKANSEVILPFKTKSYSDIKDQETGGIAACTLNSFPNLILHCIEWAKPKFKDVYEMLPNQINTLLTNPNGFFEQLENEGSDKARLKFLKDVDALTSSDRSLASAVQLGQQLFVECHRDLIRNLQLALPEDSRITDPTTGADLGPFWTGAKRYPQAAELDKCNDEHSKFVFEASNLYLFMFGLPFVSREEFNKVYKSIPAPAPWEKPKFLDIQIEDNKADGAEGEQKAGSSAPSVEGEGEYIAEELARLEKKLRGLNSTAISAFKVNEFEKDDDTNFHIDFITSVTNMRAWNYRIKAATRLHVKTTAGRIIAALATTTAMITGVTCLEYYKLTLGEHYLHKDRFSNTNVNLASAVFNAFEPEDAIKAKPVVEEDTVYVPYPRGYTSWDYIDVTAGDITIRELIDLLPKLHYGVRPTQMFKANLSDAEIAAGKGQALFVVSPDVVPHQALAMLAKPTTTGRIREVFEKQVKDAETRNALKRESYNKKVIDVYREIYGDPSHASANFIVLDGSYDVPQGDDNVAKVASSFDLKLPETVTSVKANIPKIRMFFPASAFQRSITPAQ